MTRRSGHCRHYRQDIIRLPSILMATDNDSAACASARLSPGRAVLAVRRSAGAADRRGARRARSRAERGAVRHAEAAVFGHARVSRRSTVPTSRARWRWRAASAEYREIGAGDGAAPPRPLLSARRRSRCATCSSSSGGSTPPKCSIDDRPVPYARELWLPLIWFLIR